MSEKKKTSSHTHSDTQKRKNCKQDYINNNITTATTLKHDIIILKRSST